MMIWGSRGEGRERGGGKEGERVEEGKGKGGGKERKGREGLRIKQLEEKEKGNIVMRGGRRKRGRKDRERKGERRR